jgi:FAD-NAD(P)-binding
MNDVVIVGSGPAGLACLSAIQEPYSIDTLPEAQRLRAAKEFGTRRKYRVAIVDPSPRWLSQWRERFEILGIQTLRSPAMAHPDLFDQNALLAFAMANGREKELIESGCGDITSLIPLGQPQVGLWKLPSTRLFQDFCDSMIQNLSHDYVCDTAIDVTKEKSSGCFEVRLKSGKILKTKALILATGVVGTPSVSLGLKSAKNVIQWILTLKGIETKEHSLVLKYSLSAVD